ncbi:MAG: hypothetical protein ABIK67_05850 [candidate division WOR-3 bacterium]
MPEVADEIAMMPPLFLEKGNCLFRKVDAMWVHITKLAKGKILR